MILALLPMHFHRSNPFFVNTKIRTGSVCVLCPPRKSSSLSGPYRRNRAPCLKQCLSVLIVPITEIVNLFSLLELFLPAHSTPSSDLSSRSQLKRLQRVQNSAARMIFNLRKHDPVSNHLKTLRWLSVPNRAKYRVACLSFRCLSGSAPSYLSSLLTSYSPSRDLRSGGKNLLVVKPYRLAQYGKRAFSRAAPLIWNSLSDSVRQAPTLSTFRSRFFKELFSATNPI